MGADDGRLVVRSRRDRDEARARLLARADRPLPSLLVTTAQGLAYHVVGARFRELGYLEPPQILSAADQFAKVHVRGVVRATRCLLHVVRHNRNRVVFLELTDQLFDLGR